ncbi:glycerol-3-phosphate 1-O-acyltransferase PlsB [Acinetobacter qingfengensis]|uniref:Glycerol-3-phosphate acyltransferase n=1 Tax=Acinetobacter qingfengensis TaxID=1262585 RepID=A0A1E7R2X5_9GAMM|nr:glycerol-3-phosphate 1-O-acyltransferase PlsB [Acinetobacter qingfengensis]KAA8733845.1 glycerol-3-phosphate 1-O-acyltransferase PlsB [Acinetobacter qingfengensis]OEY93642.1 glycerol-3-phosphate 1-O-acyltransferase [Acinetobacter qingfengensis]
MDQSGFSKLSHRLSSKLLDLMVKPKLLGEAPSNTPVVQLNAVDQVSNRLTVYVLQNYSRSNAILLDNETERLKLPRALQPLHHTSLTEKNAVIFLQQPQQQSLHSSTSTTFPPRLLRLIEALEQHPELDIELVPVTILWGREPDKEDSLFKLLFTDSWSTPSKIKQLVNIGVHGRQTFIEFHQGQSLRELITYAREHTPNLSAATYVISHMNQCLDSKREAILGPDLSDRRNVMQSLIKSRDVQEAILQETIRSKISVEQAEQRAIAHLNEIVSDYSYSTVRFAETMLTRLWTQLYDGVEVNNFSTVRDLADKYEIIYVPCHRSHIDYLLLSYVIFKRGLRVPYIAAGDNLNLPFVGQMLRGGGAFFIRRTFNGAQLYTAVFKEYLYSIVSRNTPLEYFIEGGRSRTGRLLPPKTGMLAMTIHSHLRGRSKPIAFIPTYIGYERLMEGATYVGEMQGKPKEAESVWGLFKTLRKIERIFGKVHLNFGEPVFLDDVFKQQQVTKPLLQSNKDALPNEVSDVVVVAAHQIMENINRAAVINPVSLLSLILLATDKHTLDEQSCIHQIEAYQNLSKLLPYDERTQLTALSGKEIIAYGLKLKLIKRIKHALGDIIAIEDNQAVLLTYFRNNILHLFILPSLVASLVEHNGRLQRDELIHVIKALYPFLKAELFLKWQTQELDQIIDQYCEVLSQQNLLLDDDQGLYSPAPNSEQHRQLLILATPVRQSLERYFMTLALIAQRGSGQISARQVEDLSQLLGQRLSVLYEFNSPEFFDKGLFQSFIKVLTQQGYIQTNESGLIEFDERLSAIAKDAPLVLDEDTLQMLAQITKFNDEELKQALDAVARQKSRIRKAKARKK